MEKSIVFPLIIIVIGIHVKFILFSMIMSYLSNFRRYATEYEKMCISSGDSICKLFKAQYTGEFWGNECSIFEFKNMAAADISSNNIQFPTNDFMRVLVWLGAVLFILIFFSRCLYEIVWLIRRISAGKLEKLKCFDNQRGLVSFWGIIIQAILYMWMYPLFSFHFHEDCLQTLLDRKDRGWSENSRSHTVALSLFSLLILPLAIFMYRKFKTNKNWMRATLCICLLFNIVFVTVSTYRAFNSRFKLYLAFAAFIVLLWASYILEIIMFWVGYYEKDPQKISSIISDLRGDQNPSEIDADRQSQISVGSDFPPENKV